MTAIYAGFSLGFSLILAIGAQNAYVLKQGLRNNHVFIICLLCACSDALLIIIGVFSFARIVAEFAWLEPAARYFGAAFLLAYGARSFYMACKSSQALYVDAKATPDSRRRVLTTCLALTWLNPHAYLDTVLLLGSISTQYPNSQVEFAGGAALSSFVFFFTLGYAARNLNRFFSKPAAWRILDLCVAAVMWWIAISLIIV